MSDGSMFFFIRGKTSAEKRKKKKVEEEKKCHDKGALFKYFGGTESAQSQSTSSGSTVSDESGPSPSSTVLSHTPPSSVPTVPSMSETTADLSTTSTTTSPSHHGPSSAPPVDPAEWPSFLSDSDRTEQEFPLILAQMAPRHREAMEAKMRGMEFRGKQASLKTAINTNRAQMDSTLKAYQSAWKIHQSVKRSYETTRKTFETARKNFEKARRALDIKFGDLNCDLKLLQTKREHEIELAQLKAELGSGGPLPACE
ncbi:uncharacterized protein [Nerophis lumbriciformis]|uniref:uncharacterized protein n=1 Tax=Nerophis lumbriciformis TaxID=546530 RepID=UPI003BAB4375